jgi:hypothetical protein
LCLQVLGWTWRWSGKASKHSTRKPNSHFSVTCDPQKLHHASGHHPSHLRE